MKRYPAYKESGIEWIGDVPEEWDMKKVKFLVDLIVEKAENSNENEFKVALENIESFTGMYRNGSEMFEGVGNYFKKGDVLFNKLRPYLAKVFVALDDGVAVGELLVLRPKYDYEQKFLFFRFLSSPFISTVNGATYGSKMPRANWDLIGNIKVPTPNKENQKVLAKYLDHKTHLIDALIEKKQKQIELLQEQRAGIINHAVTKGLNPNVKMKDTGIEWLGEVPEHWAVGKLKNLLKVKDGTHATPPYVEPSEHAYPLVTSKDIKNGEIDFTEAKFISEEDHLEINVRSDVQKDDVIMPMIGTIGNPAIVKTERRFSIKNVALFKSSISEIDPRYICFYLLSDCVTKQFDLLSRGGVQGFVSLDILRNLIAFKFNSEEQKQIVEHLDLMATKIDMYIMKIKATIELLQEFRTTLISEVVTGKIDVRDEVIP